MFRERISEKINTPQQKTASSLGQSFLYVGGGYVMRKTKRLTPLLPKELEMQSFVEALDDHYISNCRISQETIDLNIEEALHIDRVVFENVTFLETSWPRSEFVDVVF